MAGIGGTECEEPGGVLRLLVSILQDYPATEIGILQYAKNGAEQTSINFMHSCGLFEGGVRKCLEITICSRKFHISSAQFDWVPRFFHFETS